MSPPVRSKYVTSPPPRANSTPPANHHLNNQQQQRQIEDYEYAQLMMVRAICALFVHPFF